MFVFQSLGDVGKLISFQLHPVGKFMTSFNTTSLLNSTHSVTELIT